MSENQQRYRFLERYLPPSDVRRLAVITGARQTGKTTLSKRKYHRLNYINLDAPENREILDRLPSASWSDVVGHAVLDEAQKAPAVFEKVKYAFDADDIRFTVLMGSSQILLLKKIRESLAGRAFFFELWPLMMSELNLPADARDAAEPLIHRILNEKNLKRQNSVGLRGRGISRSTWAPGFGQRRRCVDPSRQF